MTLQQQPVLRKYHHTQLNAQSLKSAKHDTTVSVCLPARNEEATVGRIVGIIRTELVERHTWWTRSS
jgi:ornithine carbamoyltransferase